MADALICGVWAPHEPAAETMPLYTIRLSCKKSAQIEEEIGQKSKQTFCVLKLNLNATKIFAKLEETHPF